MHVEVEIFALAFGEDGAKGKPFYRDVVHEARLDVEAGDQVASTEADVNAMMSTAAHPFHTSPAACTI